MYEAIFSSSRGYKDSEGVFCWGVCSVRGLTLLCKAQQPLPSSFLLSVQTRTLDMLFAFGFLHEAQRAEAYKARSPVWH